MGSTGSSSYLTATMTTDHVMRVHKWGPNPNTYRAECSCGWVARWAQTSRAAADDDGSRHLQAVKVTVSFGTQDFWHPGV